MRTRTFLALSVIALVWSAFAMSAIAAAPVDWPATRVALRAAEPTTKAKTTRPTKTPTAAPTGTAMPSRTPTSTSTSTPYNTPTPTNTPEASNTPTPTETPYLEDTPMPAQTPTATPAATDTPPPGSLPRIYWGVNLSGVPWDMNILENWETRVASGPDYTHKHVSIVNYGHFWGDSGSQTGYREFSWSAGPLNNIRAHGSIPMITWTPEGGAITWQLSDIIAGVHDPYIARFAQGLRDWQGGAPVFLRLMHEMNGNWGYPWQEDYNLNQRGEFVQAWRHIVDIFRANNANNASFVWCPNVEWAGSTYPSFDSLWPEDDQHPNQVDWACIDGYNRNQPWLTFDQIFRYSYDQIVNSPKINHFGAKPIMIGEWGSVDGGGQRAGWLTDALTVQMPTNYPRIRAQVYYHFQDGNYDWRFDAVESSRAAWSDAIRQPFYTTNAYGNLQTSPVPVP